MYSINTYGLFPLSVIGAQSYQISMRDSSQEEATLLFQTILKVMLLFLLPRAGYCHDYCKSKARGFW